MISTIKHIICFIVMLFLCYFLIASITTFIRWDFMYTFPGDWEGNARGTFLIIGSFISVLCTIDISDNTRILK